MFREQRNVVIFYKYAKHLMLKAEGLKLKAKIAAGKPAIGNRQMDPENCFRLQGNTKC
jgi:hypothetical protein